MPRIAINEDRCKGCWLCTKACPRNLVQVADYLNIKGYRPARFVDPDGQCIGCAFCAMMCPDVAIVVSREEQERKE